MNAANSINQTSYPGSPNPGQRQDPQQDKGIRTWRVGSLSMGITLMLIGTALAVSLWQDAQAYELMLWVAPIVFIMLGVELLLHLKWSGSGNTVVRFDWISVFFVGCIGTASLALAMLMSTGLFDELKRGLDMTQRTVFVETDKIAVPDDVTKIVVQSSGGVAIQQTELQEVHLMGQIRYWSADRLSSTDVDLMRTQISGSTMYVMIGAIDRKDGGIYSESTHPMLMLTLPAEIEVEQYGF